MQMIACEPLNSRPSSRLDAHAVADALDVGGAGAQLDRHAALEERLVHDVGDVAILRGQDLRPRGEQRDARAAALEELGELAAGRAGADHQELLGERLEPEHVARVEHALVIDLGERRLPGSGAGTDEQVVVLERARTALGRHDEHAVALDGALAVDDRGLDQIEALAHTARLVLSDEARVRHGAQQIHVRAPVLEDDAARLRALDLGHRRGHLQQRLGRNAVGHRPVAAQRHAVDDRDLGAQRGGGRGGGIAGRAGSQDHEAHVLTLERV